MITLIAFGNSTLSSYLCCNLFRNLDRVLDFTLNLEQNKRWLTIAGGGPERCSGDSSRITASGISSFSFSRLH